MLYACLPYCFWILGVVLILLFYLYRLKMELGASGAKAIMGRRISSKRYAGITQLEANEHN